MAISSANSSTILKAAQSWAQTRQLDLGKLDPAQQQAAIRDVAKSTGLLPALVREALLAQWALTNEQLGSKLGKSGGGGSYTAGTDSRTLQGSAMGFLVAEKMEQKGTAARLSKDEFNVLTGGMLDDQRGLTASGSALRKALVDGAHEALAQTSFDGRNAAHARAVAQEASLLAAHSIGVDQTDLPALRETFEAAVLKAGEAFRGAFDAQGNKIEANEKSVFKPAMSAAGPIAYAAAKELDPDIGKIVDKAGIEDCARLVANDLGLKFSADGARLKANLQEMSTTLLKDDYFKDKIADLPVRDQATPGLKKDDLDSLNIGLRLANATWKSGQVHRAAWEGNDGRINPEKRTAYNPYDQLKAQMYDEALNQLKQSGVANPEEKALTRVAFEIYKDLVQLKDARAAELQ